MFGRGTSGKAHPFRNLILGLLVIWAVVMLVPDLGAGHAMQQSTANLHNQQQSPEGDQLGAVDQDPNQLMTWIVLRHQGWNDSFGCWILQLDRSEGPQQETTSQFCAKDRADYDAHPDGSTYITKGGWLSNLVRNGENTYSRNDHT
jgi:hypothetical protein